MTLDIQQLLATKNIHPSQESIALLEKKWKETLELKGNLSGINIDDGDIALKNIAGGDHH